MVPKWCGDADAQCMRAMEQTARRVPPRRTRARTARASSAEQSRQRTAAKNFEIQKRTI